MESKEHNTILSKDGEWSDQSDPGCVHWYKDHTVLAMSKNKYMSFIIQIRTMGILTVVSYRPALSIKVTASAHNYGHFTLGIASACKRKTFIYLDVIVAVW